ncbi:S1/P1 nuclease [Hymenobacter chitinivorans]|uniref:S1/P1 nuclease n=1 Tax=Hymenobacter chitinivorans DSM 11115 TaxID=1121954 RepID=A0A2M9BSI2_9BACT|nr:S1/P1 nuclease [Hymenobacter chitinivorans]PJJ60862.1 S1/P1 nuclease [Hymenobacter chitinivorans DSM 11115]
MLKKCVALFCLSLLPVSLMAWGVQGHRVVGKIAENHLSKKAKDQVALLLGAERLPLVTTWADEVRYSPEYSATAPWHFINTALGLPFAEYTGVVTAMQEPNAYLALNQNLAVLKDAKATKEQKVVALKFVIHIVGDVHQPMHVSRAEDKGGNAITVKYQGKDTNLHSLWDSGLLDYEGMTYSELATLLDKPTPVQVQQWQKDGITQWLWESYSISQQLYAETEKSATFDYKYVPAHLPTVEDRLLQAGVRLAGLLNGVLG